MGVDELAKYWAAIIICKGEREGIRIEVDGSRTRTERGPEGNFAERHVELAYKAAAKSTQSAWVEWHP